MTDTLTPALQADKLVKIYDEGPARIEVLSNVSLTVARGEMVAIVGASGSGKSTLLHILGLLDVPSSGSVSVDGQLAVGLTEAKKSQVEDDAREEPGLGRAQQEAQEIEHVHAGHEHHARRDDAPGDHDPRDPDARADFVEDDVAGDLEQEIADEEYPRAQPVHRLAELEFLQHLQLGEAHVDAVQVGHDIADDQ